MFLLGEPKSLKFWEDEKDEEGNQIAPSPSMQGKQLPTQIDALRNIAFLQQTKKKSSIQDLALETVDTIDVYWKMGKIPTQESTKGPMRKVVAAKRLRNTWLEYQVFYYAI